MTFTVTVHPSPLQMAQHFCELDDEAQAQFFIEAASIMAAWGTFQMYRQISTIAGHLKTCACSTELARDFVRELGVGVAP